VATTDEGPTGGWASPLRFSPARLATVRVPATEYDLDRLRGLSDCVFAVAITLVVATFRLPPAGDTSGQMTDFLAERWPTYVAYLAGFLVIGYYWLSHHRLFEIIVRADARLVALNFGLLFFVVLLPYATEVLGGFRYLPDAYRFLDLLAICLGVVNAGMWWYATTRRRLVGSVLQPAALRIYRLRAAWLPVGFVVSYLLTLPAPPYEPGIGSNWVRLSALSWGLLFLGRPLIRLVMGPVPDAEVEEEEEEVDDEATGEIEALRGDRTTPMTSLERALRSSASMGRLISFSDNVYAFAITLLGTHFVAPTQPQVVAVGLDRYLRDQLNPVFAAYTLGFYAIALFWVLHHRMFNAIERQDGILRVLNLGHLMLLAVIPITTDLLSTFDDDQLPFVVYAVSAGLVSASLAVVFTYAAGSAHLVSDDLSEQDIRIRRQAMWFTVVCFTASVVCALIHIGGFEGWTVAWIFWLFPLVTYVFLTRRT
jgi:uncharacterized membrane protein